MSLYDFLIIYLSLGAPFAVYYFLQNRNERKSPRLWLKTILKFLFWLPFAYKIARKSGRAGNFFKNIFDGESFSDAETDKNIHLIQKQMEKKIFESDSSLSIYEFRETLERYAGLTLAGQFEAKDSQNERVDFEIFRVAGNKQTEIAAACLQRRNRKRLSFHHTQSRLNFLTVIQRLFDSDPENEQIRKSAIDFVTLLNDAEALETIEKMFGGERQTAETPNVKISETEIWKSDKQKPQNTKSISVRLKALTTVTNLRGKD